MTRQFSDAPLPPWGDAGPTKSRESRKSITLEFVQVGETSGILVEPASASAPYILGETASAVAAWDGHGIVARACAVTET
jgi:hypothetical protein